MSQLTPRKAFRLWIVSTRDGAALIGVTDNTFRALVRDGYIRKGARKGTYLLGAIIDGWADAVAAGRVSAPMSTAKPSIMPERHRPDFQEFVDNQAPDASAKRAAA